MEIRTIHKRRCKIRISKLISLVLLLVGFYVLYAIQNVWTPTITGIALLFGIGNAFDSVVSLVAYAFLLRKENINVLKVE